ncbi:protein-export chaperone SecB, partial [bacterium]|nr:protein-export chaperone SecB [bacterium]
MTENYKIIGSFIKDMSSETPDIPTHIFVRDKISKYKLNIDINSKAVKNGIIEVNTIIKFSDQPEILKKAHFEITYSSIVKIDEKVTDKKEMEKIILCDVPNKI